MMASLAMVLGSILSVSWGLKNQTFPPGFKFGVASAAYQVEGAWNVSDKSESVWDRHAHSRLKPENSTGDVACDSYHQWKRDVEMMAELGVHFYRFSISWPRLLPQGFATYISEDGKNYYNNLIDALLEKGIEPLVTLYHWDLPQRLQDLGGWTNPLVADWFASYARVAFSLYGDRVKTWITINEVIAMCDLVYNIGLLAPSILDEEVAPYLCNKHAVIAHAKAYRIYDEEFKGKYHGQISIANQMMWIDPVKEEDEELAELVRLNMARSVHPIFSKDADWPPALVKIIAENSRKRGYPSSSLPPFTDAEKELIKGTYDYYALNHYTSRLVRKARPGEKLSPWPLGDCKDLDAILEHHPSWNRTASSWHYVYPKGLRQDLIWLKKQYGDINFVITENGFPTNGGLNDVDRIRYYKANLEQVLLAIKEDGVNVTGFTAWTLMDNFEWLDEYNSKFGLYEVDFTSPQRTRTPRASAFYYASIVDKHSLDVPIPEIKLEENVKKIDKGTITFDFRSARFIGLIIALIVAVFVAIAAYVLCAYRKRNAAAASRDAYASVKTVAD